MSGPVIVIALLAFALAAGIWKASRALRHASEQVQRIDEECANVPAAPDNERGVRLDWADECALIYAMPAPKSADPELEAGCARMWAAIRNEQQKGETNDA